MEKEEFRVRNRNIHVMATDYEYSLIEERMEVSGKKSMREYIIDMAVNGYVINVDYSDLKELTYEINRIGNNINQIAHKINSENTVYKTEIDSVKDNMELITRMLRAKFYQAM